MLSQSQLIPRHIVVIGGGFSGTLLAINLMRHNGPRVTIIERGVKARGMAYATSNASHLLNVRASNMSAFPDKPDHFANWFEQHGGQPDGFASRQLYGRYLGELLETAQNQHSCLELIDSEAVHLSMDQHAVAVVLDDGRTVHGDIAVLAVGNLPPHPPPGLNPEALGDRYRSDSWSSDITVGLQADDRVLLIGTGLTAVDAALTLNDAEFTGTLVAISRRGLLPRAHGNSGHSTNDAPVAGTSFAKLLHQVRRRTIKMGWRQSVDELRPVTQRIWQRANVAERERFLRHLRPWWDVHRHRLAPQIAERLANMQMTGMLHVYAGALVNFVAADNSVKTIWRPRGSALAMEDRFTRIINCTGAGGDLSRSNQILLHSLVDTATIRPDAARLGIDVDSQCRTLNAQGAVNHRLLAVGPLTRGTFWEITAVPDIRRQVWEIARRLSNAHWVGGDL